MSDSQPHLAVLQLALLILRCPLHQLLPPPGLNARLPCCDLMLHLRLRSCLVGVLLQLPGALRCLKLQRLQVQGT